MQVAAINFNKYLYQIYPSQQGKNKNQQVSITKPIENPIDRSIYSQGASVIPFTASTNILRDYIYQKSLIKHNALAKELDVGAVRDYFQSLGIPYDMSDFSLDIQKIIGYCCFNTSEIFRQLNMVLPVKLVSEYMDNNLTLGACYFASGYNKPIRTVVFNPNYDWDDFIMSFNDNNGHFSTGHFLHTFIHEFVHNINFHRIYSKFGCPEPNPMYYYNPDVARIMNAFNSKIYDNDGNVLNNNYISDDVRITLKDSSGYGSTLLPETLAEEITRNIVNCLDLMELRLNKNPFPVYIPNPKLNQVVYEAWEGLIDDGQGLI